VVVLFFQSSLYKTLGLTSRREVFIDILTRVFLNKSRQEKNQSPFCSVIKWDKMLLRGPQ